jgi:hypothetical protein
MADVKISQLNEVADPYLTDVLPIVNNGETKKVSIENILKNTYQGSDVKALTGRYEAVSTIVQYSSGNWNSVYNTVTALSASWEESAEILPTVTNYLSTNNVLISSLFVSNELEISGLGTTVFYVNENKVGINTESPNEALTVVGNISSTGNIYGNIEDLTQIKSLTSNWDSTYTEVQANSGDWEKAYDIGTAYSLVSSTFITFESDNQTLSYDENSQELSIRDGNTVNLKSLVTFLSADSRFLSLTGGIIDGDLTVLNNFYVNGSSVFINAQDLIVSDPIIYIGEDNIADTLDLGIIASWTDTNYNHGGLVRRSDNKIWTLFSGVTAEPLSGINVEWDQEGLKLETLSANFAGDLVRDTIVYGSLSAQNNIYGTNINYQNWDDAYTAVTTFYNTLSYDGSDLKALTGKFEDVSNLVQSNSAQWNQSYDVSTVYQDISGSFVDVRTAVNNTSGNWDTAYNWSSIFTNVSSRYDSTSTVVESNSGNWDKAYDISTAYSLVSSTFLTSETDSQTLNFNEITKDLSISNGNIVSLSALIDLTAVDTGVRTLTSNWQDTYTTVQNYSASWEESLEILPTVTNYLSTNNVVISSLQILQSDVVIGSSGPSTFYVENNKVGINTEFANKELTVVGDISATGQLFGDGSQLTGIIAGDTEATTLVRANSGQWNHAYDISTAYSLASSTFLTSETDSQTLLFDEVTKDLSISNGNTISLSALTDFTAIDTGVRTLTSNWESTYTTVQNNSADWNYQGTDIKALSGNWQSTYNTFQSTSATYVKTVETTTPGTSAVTTIVAVSALPLTQQPGTLYILI